jgi:hypothetical protein
MPDPTAKSQRWSVAYDGRRYDVKFFGDEACEVQVRVKRRMGMEGWRMLWSRYGHRDIKDRAAEIIDFVWDPASAERAGAVVEDEAMRAARTRPPQGVIFERRPSVLRTEPNQGASADERSMPRASSCSSSKDRAPLKGPPAN